MDRGGQRRVPTGDLAAYAREVLDCRTRLLSGEVSPPPLRLAIWESWRRVRQLGVDPDTGAPAPALDSAELERRRQSSGLGPVLPLLRRHLCVDDSEAILVVVDADSRLLWREGSRSVRTKADRLGFAEGACWAEDAQGTNAVGTALAMRKPVEVFATEHFVRSHHTWTCAAAPIHDRRTGRLLGVVDVSGPATTQRPTTLRLVAAVAELAEAELAVAHLRSLEQLRSLGAPILAGLRGRAAVTDQNGWVVGVKDLPPLERIQLPTTDGGAWIAGLGHCRLDPLPGGWLVRVEPEHEPGEIDLVLDRRRAWRPVVEIRNGASSWQFELSPRQGDLLAALIGRAEGASAKALAVALYGDATHAVTVRAELSRLRRRLGSFLLGSRPYRLDPAIRARVLDPPETMGHPERASAASLHSKP